MYRIVLVQHGEKIATPGDPGLTPLGQDQARRTAEALGGSCSPSVVVSSPLRRARETAAPVAEAFGLEIEIDDRLTERLNWDGRTSFAEFLQEWRQTSSDRDHVPAVGDSSRKAGRRFLEALADRCRGEDGSVIAVAHGGVTVDLLRTLLGDETVRGRWPTLIDEGIPSCALTRLSGTTAGFTVDSVADQDHLSHRR